jgi:hypothetical protein
MAKDEATSVELQVGKTREKIKRGALRGNGGREIVIKLKRLRVYLKSIALLDS